MRKYLNIAAIALVSVCALGAGRAFYASVEGLLVPGVVRAYPATIEDLYSDGTVSAKMTVWSGVETTVRIRLTGIAPTDINTFIKVIQSKVVGTERVVVQTVENYDRDGVLFGTVYYGTRSGYRDIALDLLESRSAEPLKAQVVRPVPQPRREVYQEEPRRTSSSCRSSGGSGKIDGKKIVLEILGNVLSK